ncbi:MAG: MATE family efflux transporter [Muribaculaceae bacterium]|nr:MATE family efflux transporter [Muribaculaceae bacterium]
MKCRNKDILRLAVPAIFNNITVPLLGISDTAIVGHLGNDVFLAAMAVGAMMFNVIFMLCGFLRMGTTGLTAQANGADDRATVFGILRQASYIALAIAMVVLAFRNILAEGLLLVISPDENIAAYALGYFRIVVWSVPAQLAVMAASGWFIGRKNTLIPMLVAVATNILNIILSVTLVYGFHMGFEGVAIGTLSANWAAFIAMAIIVAGTDGFRKTRFRNVPWKQFFNLNTDLFFRSACIMGVSLAMTSVGARIGETTLAANSVMLQFFLFFSYFMDGFAFAGEALVGNAVGARSQLLLTTTVRALLRWGVALSLIFGAVYLIATPNIVALLADSRDVSDAIEAMKGWLVAIPVVTVWAFIFDGVFIGLARSRPLLVVTLIASVVFFCVVFLSKDTHSAERNSFLWLAFETYLLLRGVLLAAKFLILQRKSLIL